MENEPIIFVVNSGAHLVGFLLGEGDGVDGFFGPEDALRSPAPSTDLESTADLAPEAPTIDSLTASLEEVSGVRARAEDALAELSRVSPDHPLIPELKQLIADCKELEGRLTEALEVLTPAERDLASISKSDDSYTEKREALQRAQQNVSEKLSEKTASGRDMGRTSIDGMHHITENTEELLLKGAPGMILIEKNGEFQWVSLREVGKDTGAVTFDDDAKSDFPNDLGRQAFDLGKAVGGIRITEGIPALGVHAEGSQHYCGKAFDFMPQEPEYGPDGRLKPEQVAKIILAGDKVGLKIFFEAPEGVENTEYEKKIIDQLIKGGMGPKDADARVRDVSHATGAHFHAEQEDRDTKPIVGLAGA